MKIKSEFKQRKVVPPRSIHDVAKKLRQNIRDMRAVNDAQENSAYLCNNALYFQ